MKLKEKSTNKMSKRVIWGSRCVDHPEHKIQFWVSPHCGIFNTCTCGKITGCNDLNHYEFFAIVMKIEGRDISKSYDDANTIMNESPEKYRHNLGDVLIQPKVKKI